MALHCWEDRAYWAEQTYGFASEEWAEAFLENGTCMLPAGHDGPHVFTPDTQIGVTFIAPADEPNL